MIVGVSQYHCRVFTLHIKHVEVTAAVTWCYKNKVKLNLTANQRRQEEVKFSTSLNNEEVREVRDSSEGRCCLGDLQQVFTGAFF